MAVLDSAAIAVQIDAIRDRHPNLDLVHADLLDRTTRTSLGIASDAQHSAELLQLQRMLRIDPDHSTAAKLLAAGMDSAHRVAAVARSQFVKRLAGELGDDGARKAGEIHDKATLIKTRVAHLTTSLHSILASRHARMLAGGNVAGDVADYFQTLSSYGMLFGSLDYCDARQGETILDPPAYLVDLLRIINLAITTPNTTRPDAATVKAARDKYDQGTPLSDDENRLLFTQNIPPGLNFDERRPDIGQIPLTAANAFDEQPYLEIINAILDRTVAAALTRAGLLQNGDLYLTLANLYYPFALPYHRPLDRIRTLLTSKKSSLTAVYRAFVPTDAVTLGDGAEYLGLSAEQVGNLAPPNDVDKHVSDNYGLAISAGNLAGMDDLAKFMARTGLAVTDVLLLLQQDLDAQEFFDTSGTYQTTGRSKTLTLVQNGDRVTGTYDSGGTIDCALRGTVLNGYWQQGSGNAVQSGTCQFTFTADGTSFQGRWRNGYAGDWDATAWNGTRPTSSVGIIPHSFFINRSLAARQYLQTAASNNAPNITVIAGQTPATLDNISRFARLSTALGWSYADLDWVLMTLKPPTVDGNGNITSPTELDGSTLVELAKIKRLIEDHGLSIDLATAMWFDIRTIRRGSGQESAAPFDTIFNSAAILRQFPERTVYRPLIAQGATSYVNPLYTMKTTPWGIGDSGASNAVGSAIVGCIPANADDVAAIAVAAFSTNTIDLTVANLSLLYRHAMLAKQLNLRAPVYIALLDLLGLNDGGKLPATFDRDKVLRVLDGAAWIKACGISIPDLAYLVASDPAGLLAGSLGSYVNVGYDPAAIPALLGSIDQLIEPALVTAASLMPPGSTLAATACYQLLLNTGYIDPVGIVITDPTAAPPDLSGIATYDPTLTQLSDDETSYVNQVLTQQASRQLQQVAGQLATFFGAKADLMAAIVAAAARWLNLVGPIEAFMLAPVFSCANADLKTAQLPDPIKIAAAFAAKNITLPEGFSVVPQTVTTWTIEDANKVNYVASSTDLKTVDYYRGNALLFSGVLADVVTANVMDPALLVSAFGKNGVTLAAPATASLTVVPLSWSIQDGNGVNLFYCTQYGQPGGLMNVLSVAPGGTVAALIRLVSKLLILNGGIPLSARAFAALGQSPSAFGFPVVAGQNVAVNLDGIHGVYQFQSLVSAFADNKDALASYLIAVRSAATPIAADIVLCAVTGWDVSQCSWVRTKLFGEQAFANTIRCIEGLRRVFALTAIFGVDAYLMSDVAGTAQVAATVKGYESFDDVAGRLLQAVRAKVSPDAWPTVYAQVNGPVQEHQRSALVPVALWQLGQTYSDITTPRALSEFLLTDVETSSCAQLSIVKEALNAAQLYLQRCRLNLERNVTISTDDLPNVWWEWLLNYRIWQANREIFLYPENYIDPSLRRSKTALFRQLESDLLQGDVTTERVETEFRKYMDGLAQLAKLKIIDSCHAVVHDPDKGRMDTLFLIARTDTQPYKFYYIQRQQVGDCAGNSGQVWSEWLPIGITINSGTVTSIYAFNKLLIFWVEPTKKQQLDGTSDTSKRVNATTANIRYSYRNFGGTWVQPQTLVTDRTIDVSGGASLYGPFNTLFANTPDTMWGKLGCLRIPPAAFQDNSGSEERLCVFFGPMLDRSAGDGTAPPTPASYAGNTDVQTFAATIGQATLVRNQMNGLGQSGKTPLLDMVVLDSMLQPAALAAENQYLILRADALSETSAPPFQMGLNGSSLVVEHQINSLVQNYVTGTGLTVPYVIAANTNPVTATSFVSDYISATQASNFFNVLSAPGPSQVIDANGTVSAGITTIVPSMLQAMLGGPSTLDIGTARQVREVLLGAYYGTPILLSQVGARNAAVMPVNNQPGSFMLSSDGECFLISGAGSSGTQLAKLDEALSGGKAVTGLTPATLITRDIDADLAQQFYQVLTAAPNTVIDANGVVDTTTVQARSVAMLAQLLTTDLGRAQQVKNILLSGSGPSYASYADNRFAVTDSVYTLQFATQRLTSGAIDQLSQALDGGGIDALLALARQQAPVNATLPFDRLGPNTGNVPLGPAQTPVLLPPAPYFGEQVDFTGPFGLYFWELFLHAPLLVAKMLHDNQQFQAAESWLQYIFNPTLPPDPVTRDRFVALRPDDIPAERMSAIYDALTTDPNKLIDPVTGLVLPGAAKIALPMLQTLLSLSSGQAMEIRNLLVNQLLATQSSRYWQFQPFRNHTLETLKDQLTNCAEIAAYNDDPFDPDAIARLRIGAYEKAVVITYVQNLLDWGDSEFSQYSWESIVAARMLYSYAYDLLGPRPAALGPCAETVPTTFDMILARYGDKAGDIPQFLIDMENALPGPAPSGPLLTQVGVPFNDLGGVFTVPENTRLTGLWDRVEDRLYKIRNCLNIDGQPQPLPLFQPPLDPMALVRAAAAGNNVLALQAQLRPRVPYVRFTVIVQRAVDTLQTVRGFGSALLAALQESDAEGLARLHATHEIALLTMMTLIKNKAIEDLNAQLASLQQGLASAQYRQSYYDGLTSAGLIPAEITALTLNSTAIIERGGVVAFNGLSIAGYLAPNIFGFADGGMKFGDAINAGAAIAGALAEILGQAAGISQTVGEYQRRASEWSLQSKLAGYEITNTQSQIDATNARIASAQQDLAVHLQQIEHDTNELDFLKSKFTNQDLYRWMTGRLATLYFQAYRLAQEIALAAQTAYQFELDRDDQIITFGYWDNLRQGLLAGEGLALALDQLQKAYLDNFERRLEIERTVSLRQACPAAFFGFKWGFANGGDATSRGRLDFVLPEALYDFDYPGHYCRKIKSISISIPCIIGPYQELHATLRQNGDAVVMAPNLSALKYVAQRISLSPGEPDAPPAGTVRESWLSSQSIAISEGIDDDGLFVLDFKDERYLPFEGTGAVSAWSFEMPPETNPIDFDSISDVIIKVRYTARDGGSGFADQVRQYYRQQASSNPRLQSASFNLSRMFSAAWSQMMNAAPVNQTQTVTFPVGSAAIPPGLRNPKLRRILVQLEMAGGAVVNSAEGQEFLGIQISGSPTTPVPVSLVNNFGQVGVDKLPTAFTDAPWSLVFDLSKSTIGPLVSNKVLDPTKLLDVALVVLYSADPF